MYKKLTPLKQSDHGKLRLLPITDYGFARSELVAPIVIDEIADVAREYPIVFPVGSGLPVALMGLEKDSNAYVSVDGQWLATYIPAHIRHYPLALTPIPGEAQPPADNGTAAADKRFVVLVDMASACISQQLGDAVFDAEGQLTGSAQQKMRIMEMMQNRVDATQQLVKAIDGAGLLLERAIRIKREGEPDRQVTGIRVIDEAALNKLDDAAFNTLRRSGALPLVYASLLSWANFRQGAIGKTHPLPAPVPALGDEVIRYN